jgi:hypothetical protein
MENLMTNRAVGEVRSLTEAIKISHSIEQPIVYRYHPDTLSAEAIGCILDDGWGSNASHIDIASATGMSLTQVTAYYAHIADELDEFAINQFNEYIESNQYTEDQLCDLDSNFS